MADPLLFKLYDGRFEVPIWLEGGVNDLRVDPISMSSIWAQGGGAQQFGLGEPLFASLEQRTMEGGRGSEFFSYDPTRYLDSLNCWTLTPGKLIPSPQWFFGIGHRPNGSTFDMPGSVRWQALTGNQLYIDRLFTPSANITADKAYFWIRRRGTPGTLTLTLSSDSGGEPDSSLKTATITTTNVDDVISVLQAFDWTGTQALTGGTDYHLTLSGASTDDAANHWEVATNISTGGTTLYSDDGTTWLDAPYSMYYRVVGADTDVSWKFFRMRGSLYATSIYRNGTTASKLFLNGARGVATAGASTTLTDSNASFGTNSEYVGALVKIIAGTGIGQIRTISSHTNTILTVSSAWLTNPSTDSEYIIYQTKRWTEVSTTGLGVVKGVAVQNDIAHFAQGSATNIRKIRFNPGASPPAHEFADDGTNKADVIATGYVAGTGNVLWRAVGNAVSRATTAAWGAGNTFGTAFNAGGSDYSVNAMVEYTSGANSRMYVGKPNELGFIDNDKYYRLNVAFNSFPEATNAKSMMANGLYLWTNFLWSLQRLYGEALDDIDPNREAGMPDGRQGYIAGMANHPVGPIVGIDADTGTSATMFFDNINYHEIFRAWEANKRISDLIWQPNEGGKKYLWIGVGDDLVYLEFPRYHPNPFADPTQNYMHEAVYTTSTYDMNNASISKVWKDISLITKHLNGDGIYCDVYYQSNTNIDTDVWTYKGRVEESPSGFVELMEQESHQIRFRLHLHTDNSMNPPVLNAIVVRGVGQLPFKWQITFTGHFGPVAEAVGGSDTEKTLNLFANGMRNGRIWTITDSMMPEFNTVRCLASLGAIRPLYNAEEERTDVMAQITLISLDDDLWRRGT